MKVLFLAIYFGTVYMLLELIWRKRTHATMGVAGGFSASILYSLFSKYDFSVLAAYILSLLLISSVEMLAGFILNIKLKLAIWDYGQKRLNLCGQVCLEYSLIWGALGVVLLIIARSFPL